MLPRYRHLFTTIGPALLGAAVMLMLHTGPGVAKSGITAAKDGGEGLACRRMTAKAERANRIPAQLLTAISMVEAGRPINTRGEAAAWPWTVYAEGRGRYLPSKAAAIAEITRLTARGIGNIDVGCMQINLRHHGNAFRSLEEALDPEVNVAYAAKFLLALKQESRSWTVAVGRYHSRTAKYNGPYRQKVKAAWQHERKRVAAERQSLARAKWQSRHEARRAARLQRRLSLKRVALSRPKPRPRAAPKQPR